MFHAAERVRPYDDPPSHKGKAAKGRMIMHEGGKLWGFPPIDTKYGLSVSFASFASHSVSDIVLKSHGNDRQNYRCFAHVCHLPLHGRRRTGGERGEAWECKKKISPSGRGPLLPLRRLGSCNRQFRSFPDVPPSPYPPPSNSLHFPRLSFAYAPPPPGNKANSKIAGEGAASAAFENRSPFGELHGPYAHMACVVCVVPEIKIKF